MCWPWLEHVKNTTTLLPSIYSILPSVSPFCPPLPLCLYSFFFFLLSIASLSACMKKGFTSHVSFYQIPCFPAILFLFFFFWSRFVCLLPELHVWLKRCTLWLRPLVSVSGVVFLALSLPIRHSDLGRITESVIVTFSKVSSSCDWK